MLMKLTLGVNGKAFNRFSLLLKQADDGIQFICYVQMNSYFKFNKNVVFFIQWQLYKIIF